IVSLTQVKPGTRKDKEELIEVIEECINNYSYIYIFKVENMRNSYLKEVREALKPGRIFLGKNKIMQKALGQTESDAKKLNLDKFSKLLEGECGLLFTEAKPEEITAYFKEFRKADYARHGFIADKEVKLPAGILYRGDDTFPHNMEPLLRGLGLNTHIERGNVCISNEHTICKPGDKLTVQQADLLKHFYHQFAEFHIVPQYYYHEGAVTKIE
ncbi:hypothetical protein K502DRAFT_289773, partial [Neoconidiobolus thromboides FSU 785]